MIETIAYFYGIAFSVYLLVQLFWWSSIGRFALTWFGPIPEQYEYLSEFKLRRAWYAFGWLLQIIYAFTVLFIIGNYFPWTQGTDYFLVVSFALTIGFGMSLLASLGLFIS
ncbi:MAG: hypothetical protein VW874_11420, partial [Gammaproteobacteria bacterium]